MHVNQKQQIPSHEKAGISHCGQHAGHTWLRALDVAVPLAGANNGRLFLLSVVEPVAYAAGIEGTVLTVPDATLVENAKVKLSHIANKYVPATTRITCLVNRGRAFDVITQVAKKKQVDLIVLTTHGRTGISRVLLGSTAERVVRHADCPVFVVRPPRANQKQGKKLKQESIRLA